MALFDMFVFCLRNSKNSLTMITLVGFRIWMNKFLMGATVLFQCKHFVTLIVGACKWFFSIMNYCNMILQMASLPKTFFTISNETMVFLFSFMNSLNMSFSGLWLTKGFLKYHDYFAKLFRSAHLCNYHEFKETIKINKDSN